MPAIIPRNAAAIANSFDFIAYPPATPPTGVDFKAITGR